MQQIPFLRPGVIRAILGLILGFIIGLLVVWLVRLVQGITTFSEFPGYFVNFNASENFYMGQFWTDEALLMFALFFGGFGFIWGIGGLLGTPIGPSEEQQRALVTVKPKKPRIPIDPDAPIDTSTPGRQLLGTIPAMLIISVALIITVALIVMIPALNLGTPQVYSDTASTGDFGEAEFNLLGLHDFSGDGQFELLLGFSIIVIGLVLGIPLGIALIFYLLNRQVKTAEARAADPEAGQNFILIRLAGFFNQWMLDFVDSLGRGIRTR